ncbi:MAG: META domain-containing protein [Gemmobacter sp.]
MPRRLAAAFATGLTLAAPSVTAQTDTLTGEAFYRERIALDPGALLLVEARGAGGEALAEVRVPTEGRQVPLGFSLAVPSGAAITLHAGLFSGGMPQFLSGPVSVPADRDTGALPPILLTREAATVMASTFRCGDIAVAVRLTEAGVRLRSGGAVHDLVPEPAASGARYTGPGAQFWSRGNSASVSLDGAELPECAPTIPPTLLPLTARGTEPFWRLDLAGGEARFNPMGGVETAEPLPAAEALAEGLRFTLGSGRVVTLTEAIYRDAMTGMPMPLTATITQDGETLVGGAGDPRALLTGGEWRAVALEGAALPADAEITLAFLEGDRVAGKSACNRYMGSLALTGEGVTFGQMAGTMMACPDPLMTLERRWLDGLAAVSRFDIGEGGALVLYVGDTEFALLER